MRARYSSRETSRATREILANSKLRKLLVHYAEGPLDARDLARGDLDGVAAQLAVGAVPTSLAELVDATARRSSEELSSMLGLNHRA